MGGRVVAVPCAAVAQLLLRPRAQLDHLLADRADDRHLDQNAVLVRRTLADPVQARVVVPALLDRVRRTPGQQLLGGVEKGGQILVDQLGLQVQRGGGHHDALLVERVQQRRHEVAERLAGPGAGLDEQVLPRRHRLADRGRHGDLPRPGLSPDSIDRRLEQLADIRHRVSLSSPSTFDHTCGQPPDGRGTPPHFIDERVRRRRRGQERYCEPAWSSVWEVEQDDGFPVRP
jgi:hypothetical protein